jgi:hypothetical protein
MAHAPTSHQSQSPVPPPPPDGENEALIDARKTYVILLLSAVGFVGAAVFIIMRTRMG